MNMYEKIFHILESNGPAPISVICEEINQHPSYVNDREKPVQISHVKSVISRKKDLFMVNDDIVSILPEKKFISLTTHFGSFPGPWYKVKVDFNRNQFYFFEWHIHSDFEKRNTNLIGTVVDFKKELLKMKLWEWDSVYEGDDTVVDGISWSTTLVTKGKIYESRGLESYPKEWSKFYKSLCKLTGIPFA